MEQIKFHLSKNKMNFGGFNQDLEKSKFIIFGVPLDATSTFRPGSRFAPTAIREAASNIETFSFRTRVDTEEIMIYDAGDLTINENLEKILNRIGEVVEAIIKMNKTPIIIGGEHTITYGAIKNLGKNIGIISFDAHLDLRNEYPLGVKWSHATIMRRIAEKIGTNKLLFIGTRAICREEYEYIEKHQITYITAKEIIEKTLENIVNKIKNKIKEKEISKMWITIDLDVLDPAYAPGVGNPEPEGISTKQLLDIIEEIVKSEINIIGFDVVEVTPIFDNGITTIQAAKIILETVNLLYQTKLSNA